MPFQTSFVQQGKVVEIHRHFLWCCYASVAVEDTQEWKDNVVVPSYPQTGHVISRLSSHVLIQPTRSCARVHILRQA